MEKMKMHSPNLTQDNIARIREMFPGCVTEAQGEDGNLRLAVDFDQLRQELSESIVEGPQERYRLDWPGKREAMLTANAPIARTLRPCREESVDFDTTKNLFIEGDNLEALKLLQETYLSKVKMIYIDPPYNTGNDFIYEDDFAESTEEFLQRSNQQDEYGNRLVSNSESNGRFHSDWLSMMLSRLKLARNLLREDGVIFISIDESEVGNLKKISDEVFGQENQLIPFIWHLPRGINAGHISRAHEYILAYTKSRMKFPLFNKIDEDSFSIERCNKKIDRRHPASSITFPAGVRYEGPDKNIKGVIEGSESIEIIGEMIFKNGALAQEVTLSAGWTMKNMIESWIRGNEVVDSKGQLIEEFFFKENGRLYSRKKTKFESLKSVLIDMPDSQVARTEIEKILGDQDIFPYPKPTKLISKLINHVMNDGDIFLDFFAGSGTSAHSCIQLNSVTGKNIKYILIQLAEKLNEEMLDNAAAVKFLNGLEKPLTIAEISKERIRRAGAQILEGDCHENWNKDIGFRVLKVDTSNMQDVYYQPQQLKQNDLFASVDNIKPDRSSEDLLFQVLLDWGVDLTLPIRRETLQGKEVFIVDDNALVACFEQGISEALIHELAALNPLRAVFRDNGFASDAVKVNVTQIFKQRSPITEVKAL